MAGAAAAGRVASSAGAAGGAITAGAVTARAVAAGAAAALADSGAFAADLCARGLVTAAALVGGDAVARAVGFLASIFASVFSIFVSGFVSGLARVSGFVSGLARVSGFASARAAVRVTGLLGALLAALAAVALFPAVLCGDAEAFAGAGAATCDRPRFFTPSAGFGEARVGDFSPFALVRRAFAPLDFDSASAPPSAAGRFPGGLLVTTTVGRS
ncbi:MAG TPA: hypothetical protein VK698_31085 [Kofleriaceae bacterium]|nr:hypothetical protein [Kofleriaceae bacterium]